MKVLPNLTQLRFFLALLVIFFHLPEFCKNRGFPYFDELPIFHKGSEAVYVFFSLSGFLIIRNLIYEKNNTNTINLKEFYKRRALRIFPLYYLVLFIGFFYYRYVIGWFGFSDDSNYNFIEGLLLGITFFANILSSYKPGGIIEVLWSIAIEEQFYLFIAPIFLIIKRSYILTFLILFTITYFILFHLSFAEILRHYMMFFYYFSMGGVLAYISLYKTFKINILIKIIVFFSFILILTTDLFSKYLDNVTYQLVCLISFSFTIYLLSLKSYRFFDSNILRYLGKVSYGIYMYHAIVFQLVGFLFLKIEINNKWLFIILFNVLVLSLTILIASLSYKYYETPFLKKKKNYKSI